MSKPTARSPAFMCRVGIDTESMGLCIPGLAPKARNEKAATTRTNNVRYLFRSVIGRPLNDMRSTCLQTSGQFPESSRCEVKDTFWIGCQRVIWSAVRIPGKRTSIIRHSGYRLRYDFTALIRMRVGHRDRLPQSRFLSRHRSSHFVRLKPLAARGLASRQIVIRGISAELPPAFSRPELSPAPRE